MENRAAKMAISIIMLVMFISCANAQSYTTYAESSNIGKNEISRSSVVWIISDSGNFMWNRTIETSIGEKLRFKGIKSHLTTDYVDICDLKEDEFQDVLDLYLNSKSDFMLAIEIGELYTYSAGGGVKSMDFSATLIDFVSEKILLKIALSTESDTNDLKSLNETRRPVVESMSDALAKEFMRYVN